MSDKVAVVTGSNKGIGFATVRELCQRGVGTVYLTARDVTRGKEAVEKLRKEGLNPLFHQLDVTDRNSVKVFANHLKEKHGGLDILINNAGILVKDLYKTTYEDANHVIDVNYRSLFIIQEFLFPILKDNARVVNVSSDCGFISHIKNPYWVQRLTKKDIKAADVNAFVDWFLDSVKNGTVKKEDFEEMEMLAYRISKVAVTALTRAQQNEINRGISINSLNPGYVQTEMNKNVGYIPLEESGKAPVYLALDVDQSVKGKYFWYDKTEKDWENPSLQLHSRFDEYEQTLREAGVLSLFG
ncbi:carbonyl reductase [NADPH] 1-like [Hyposmocoma kahamanoa]|uniref:carbonyl reductase [NADPH] 1-like n=1 Tax=Hyposmocoma kahamanoa TaxID=1477025 RepID=UPI000E6DA54D|nr:carbonyl reductase [NADPH] 1-like [Hyposmocoma kahamanoa]